MPVISVGVVGAGAMGTNHLRTYRNDIKDIELAGVFDPDAEKAAKAAAQFGCRAFASVEELLANVAAVSIASPSVTHGAVGLEALKKGVHCLVEKPLAVTEKECLALIEEAGKRDLVLAVGHIERFNTAVLKMHEILDNGISIQALHARRMSSSGARITDVDVAMDLMIHDIEIILSMIHSEVVDVTACGYGDGADHVTAAVKFADGAMATATASRITNSRIRSLDAVTTAGLFSLDFLNQTLEVYHQGRWLTSENHALPTWADFPVEISMERAIVRKAMPLTLELEDFVRAVRTKTAPKVDGKAALNALRVIWQVQKQLAPR